MHHSESRSNTLNYDDYLEDFPFLVITDRIVLNARDLFVRERLNILPRKKWPFLSSVIEALVCEAGDSFRAYSMRDSRDSRVLICRSIG